MSILSAVRLKYLTKVLKTGKLAAAKIASGVKLLGTGACRKVQMAWQKFAEKAPIKRIHDSLQSSFSNFVEGPKLSAVKLRSTERE